MSLSYSINNIDFTNPEHKTWAIFAKRLHQDIKFDSDADIVLEPGQFVDSHKIYDLRDQDSYVFKTWYKDWANLENTVWLWHSDELSIPDLYLDTKFDTIVAPGSGFYAYETWCKLGRPNARIVIYDYNPHAIKFQKELHKYFDGFDYSAYLGEYMDLNKELYAPPNTDNKVFNEEHWKEYLKLDHWIMQTDLLHDNIIFSYPKGKTFFSVSDIFDYPELLLKYGYEKLKKYYLDFLKFGQINIGKTIIYFEKPDNAYVDDSLKEHPWHEYLKFKIPEDTMLYLYGTRFELRL
jgi:hypothetical protein